jgi:nicotinate phosphoribosyltransferase
MSERSPLSIWPRTDALGTVTDLYQMTMMAGYFASGKAGERATFEMFVRKMPKNRSYLVFAGLEQAIDDLLRLAFSRDQIEQVRHWPMFAHLEPAVIDALARQRFEGDVWSAREGTVVFSGETVLRVTAPLPQAQWVETYLLASMAYPTMVASKAARIVHAAGGRPLYEFGARRAHGPQAGILAARAAYLAGFAGTSNVDAAIMLGIPATGTMAHSWVQSFRDEPRAFSTYARVFPGSTTLLVDTYDTLEGVRHAAAIEPAVQAIRLDSGDLEGLSRRPRALLDELGRPSVKIMASGDLDEMQIWRLVQSGAPIDGFGVGTELVTSRDAPALSLVYKLVELDGEGKFKLSTGKRAYPMAKQVFRSRGGDGRFLGDLVCRADETHVGEPLLQPIVSGGRLIAKLPDASEIRPYCQSQLASLPPELLGLESSAVYPIRYSELLEADAARLMAR